MKKLTSFLISLTLILLFISPGYTGDHSNTTIQSFSKAKKILLREIYQDHKATFYCNCPFNSKKKIPLTPGNANEARELKVSKETKICL